MQIGYETLKELKLLEMTDVELKNTKNLTLPNTNYKIITIYKTNLSIEEFNMSMTFFRFDLEHLNSGKKEVAYIQCELFDSYRKRYREENTNLLYTKSGIHLEQQKIQNLEYDKYNIEEVLSIISKNGDENSIVYKRLEKDIQNNNITTVGIDLELSESYALNSIQQLFSRTNYKGNVPSKKEGIPILEFHTYEYLEAYTTIKWVSKREKNEFSSAERKEAIKALFSLADKKYLIIYRRRYKNNEGKWTNDALTQVTNLFNLISGYEKLTDKEYEKLKTGKLSNSIEKKLTKFRIEPSIILIDQIDNYFVMKDANYLKEIKERFGKVSKYFHHFIDFLITLVALQTNTEEKRKKFNWIIERNRDTIITKIRMNDSIYYKNRMKKKINDYILDFYEKSTILGYLTGYELDIQGKTTVLDRLHLNKEKFYQPNTYL